jgi:hypothetical protein
MDKFKVKFDLSFINFLTLNNILTRPKLFKLWPLVIFSHWITFHTAKAIQTLAFINFHTE